MGYSPPSLLPLTQSQSSIWRRLGFVQLISVPALSAFFIRMGRFAFPSLHLTLLLGQSVPRSVTEECELVAPSLMYAYEPAGPIPFSLSFKSVSERFS